MSKESQDKLIKRIARLAKQNQELEDRIKKLLKENEKLVNQLERQKALPGRMSPGAIEKEAPSLADLRSLKFKMATVLFADVHGFTRVMGDSDSAELIDELDEILYNFDRIAEHYKIKKIKTIGDTYMCAGGIPVKNITNPIDVVMAALEMQNYLRKHEKSRRKGNGQVWDLKIGIHTGPVTANISGKKKVSYDIKGDTVNTASRVEGVSGDGKILISLMTYELVKEFFQCEYYGKLPVKYKGDLDMYFVNGIRPELRGAGKAEPNKLFMNKLLMLKIQDLEDYYFDWYAENVPADFVFHNLKFIKNICTQTELLATAGQLGDDEILGLRLAALFVKAGMLEDYSEPLEHSLAKMKEMAPGFGFSDAYIEPVSYTHLTLPTKRIV